jgi:hypothetical protein
MGDRAKGKDKGKLRKKPKAPKAGFVHTSNSARYWMY